MKLNLETKWLRSTEPSYSFKLFLLAFFNYNLVVDDQAESSAPLFDDQKDGGITTEAFY